MRSTFLVRLVAAVGLCVLALGAAKGQPKPDASASPDAAAKHETIPGTTIENWQQATPRIFSGSQPTTDADFAELAHRGVKTIVSVDGLAPDVELAARHGLRYVHIPIGYDGLPQQAGDEMTRALRDLKGPIFVHCHHGMHRGPAMAAVAGRSCGALTQEQAVEYLKRAGLSAKYPGLWRDVKAYAIPPEGAELPPLVERAAVKPLVKRMAALDRHVLAVETRLEDPAAFGDDDWTMAEAESLQAMEHLVESLRELPPSHAPDRNDPGFRELFDESIAAADALHDAVRDRNRPGSELALGALQKTCAACHAGYRQ